MHDIDSDDRRWYALFFADPYVYLTDERIGFFKGTSADQDRRFSDKELKLLKSMKFPPEFDKKVFACAMCSSLGH